MVVPMPDAFDWNRIPHRLRTALCAAALDEGAIHWKGDTALSALLHDYPTPDLEFVRRGRPGHTVAHALRDNLSQLGTSAIELAYGQAESAGLVEAHGKRRPSTRTQAQRLNACRLDKQLRSILLNVLLEQGGVTTARTELAEFFQCPTIGKAEGKPLLPHQREVTGSLQTRWEASRFGMRGLVVMPTGAGKTRTTVDWLLQTPVPEGAKVLWLTHTVHLLEQTAQTFSDRAPITTLPDDRALNVRLIGGGYGSGTTIGSPIHDVVIATIQSFHRKRTLDHLKAWLKANNVVVVFDEAHHSVAPSWRAALEIAADVTGDAVIGLTATPKRMSDSQTTLLGRLYGAPGSEMAEAIISEIEVDRLVEEGVLAKPVLHTINTGVDIDEAELAEATNQFGEISPRILAQLAKELPRNRLVVDTYKVGPEGDGTRDFGRAIAYAVNKVHAETLVSLFRAADVNAEAVHEGHSRDENRAAIAAFRDGNVQVLVNVQMLTEGIDAPEADSVLLARPTFSLSLYSQMVGRALRGPKMGGTEYAHIVDFQDHLERFEDWRITYAKLQLLGEVPPASEEGASPPRDLVPYDIEAIVAIAVRLSDELAGSIEDAYQRIPVGYFLVPVGGTDDQAPGTVRTMLVFDHTFDGYAAIGSLVTQGELSALRRGSWQRFFKGLRRPHPTDDFLAPLRAYVLETGEMPAYVGMEHRDRFNPRTVAQAIVDGSTGKDSALRDGINEAYEQGRSVIDRVWGGPTRFSEDVFRAWDDILSGRPVALEDRRPRHRTVVHPAVTEWTWGDVEIDLGAMAAELLDDVALFPRPLRAPNGPIEWSTAPISVFGFYVPDAESITLDTRLRSSQLGDINIVRFLLFHELLHHEQEVFSLVDQGGLRPSATTGRSMTGSTRSPDSRNTTTSWTRSS